MKKQLFNLSLIMALVILFGSCGKYEEGPGFSLLTKKMRITGEWKMEKIFKNGTEQELTADSQNATMLIESDGTGKMTYTSGSLTLAVDFEWQFGDSKETFKVRMKKLDGTWDEWDESEIIRLANKEFWIKDISTTSSDIYITHFSKV